MRALRWHGLLRVEKPIGVSTVFWGTCVGYLGNSYLPARMGEVIRMVMIGRHADLSKSYVLATIITERVIDALVLVFSCVVAFAFIDAMPTWLNNAVIAMSIIGIVSLIGLVSMPQLEQWMVGVISQLPLPEKIRNGLTALLARFLDGVRTLQSKRQALRFFMLTFIIWTIDVLLAVLVAHAFNLSLAPIEALLLLAALGLSSAAPSTPGYIGIYQFVAVTVLVPFDFTRDEAIAYIVAFQGLIYAIVSIWGLLGLWNLLFVKKVTQNSELLPDTNLTL